MTDKEKNMAIYRGIEQLAVDVWQEIEPKVPEGSYTAMQVNDEVIPDLRKKMEWQELTVEVEGFRCHFLNIDVFRVLHEFGKFARVKQEDKYRFIKMEEKQTELNAQVRIDKEHKVLKAMVSDDYMKMVMGQLHLDAERGYLVASDSYILGAMRIDMKLNTGEAEDACFNLPPSFVDVPGHLDLTKHTDHTYRYYGDKVDGTYREEDGCRYPRWYSVFPELSEQLNFRLRREDVKRLMKFLKVVCKLPSNTYEKHQHRVSLYAESYAESVRVAYDDTDNDTHTEAVFLLERSMEHPLAICLCADRLLKLEKVWNGSLWFVDSTRSVVMDSDREDSYLLMPMLPADDDKRTYYSFGVPGVKYDVSWDKRYELRAVSATSYELRATSEDKREINNIQKLMGYTLESLADGTYEVRGRKEKKTTLSIGMMAKTLMGCPERQIKCQDYFLRKYGRGAEAEKHYPLTEQELYESLRDAFTEQGINPTAKQEPAPKSAPNPAPPTGHLYVVNHEAETKNKTKTEVPKQEVPKQEVPKQEVPDPAEPEMKIERSTTMVGRRFYPLLILSQGDTQVIVAGNSLYEAICDEEGDIRPMYQELFDSTDAFIDDDLLTADTLDEAAICEAVTQFMDMVENAS
ncbi:MAG: hypothetical protein ACI36Z_01330 [Alloprevotella sp.]